MEGDIGFGPVAMERTSRVESSLSKAPKTQKPVACEGTSD